MKNNSLALATAIALCVHAIGAGLVSPLAGAASVPDHNPAALGALPAWFAAIPDETYPAGAAAIPGHSPAAPGALPAWFAATRDEAHPAAGREPTADDGGRYAFRGPRWTTHPAPLRPVEREPTPVPGSQPSAAQASDRPPAGVDPAAAAGKGGGATHVYFVPFNDRYLWELFNAKNTCHTNEQAIGDTLISSIFLIASSDRTIYYYDHWEDGYDADPLRPEAGSSTERGMLRAGGYRVFQDPGGIVRGQVENQTVFFYDGRDRITVEGEQATVVRQAYPGKVPPPLPPGPTTKLAAAWEVPEVDDWGTGYVATVGEDLADSQQDDHRFAGLEVMAAQNGTEVYYNGVLADTLGAGGTHPITDGVDSSDTITATGGPIQVQMMTGSCGIRYSAHGYTLQPVDAWGSSYRAPVPGFDQDDPYCAAPSGQDADTDVYLHNPDADEAIVVTMTMSSGEGIRNITITIPSRHTVSVLAETPAPDMVTGTWGAHFHSLGKPFWGVGVIDSATKATAQEDFKGRNFDWGYSLVAESELSSKIVVGYAPGNGLDPPDDNGNMAFVTAITDTVLYVDLDQNGCPDPFDMDGDGNLEGKTVWGEHGWDEGSSHFGVPLRAGQVLRVGDPYKHDLTGALIYTQDLNERIGAAWGQDPCRTEVITPYLDLGYTLLPTWVPRLAKTCKLDIDADNSLDVSPGDTLACSVLVHNNGMGVMPNVVLTDRLPYTYTDFMGDLRVTTPPLTHTEEYSKSTWATWRLSHVPDAEMLRITWPEIGSDQMVTVTFRVRIHTVIPPEINEICNEAVVDSDKTDPVSDRACMDLKRPLLSIDKWVSPSTVRPGGRVTYTVLVSNGGAGMASNVAITDVLPSWLEYVEHTLDLTWPIAHAVVTTHTEPLTSSFRGSYNDDFDLTISQTTNYSGSDCSLEWSTDWTEVNDDGDPGSGEVQVRMDGNALSEPAHLWMEDADGDDAGVTRTTDLSEFVAPTLRYYVSGTTDLDGNDFYRVEVNGIPELQEQYSGGYTIQEIGLPITAAGDPAVTLGLLASGGLEDGEYYRFDHISIYEGDPFRVVSRTVIETQTVVLSYTTHTGRDPAFYDPFTGDMVIAAGMQLPVGGSITATFQAQVAIPLTDGLTLTNTACTTASNWLQNLSEPCDDAPVRVQADHGLTITKTATPSPVRMGGLLIYTLNYLTAGDEAVEYMVVSDTTPVSTTFHAAAPTATLLTKPAVGGRGPVMWQLSSLWPPGGGVTQRSGTLTMVVRVHTPLISGTLIHNSVIITDTTGLSDTAEVTTPVYAAPGLELIKMVDPSRVMPNMPFTYALHILNTGSYTFTALRLTDTLPANFWYVDGSGRPVDPDVIAEPLLVWSDVCSPTLVPNAGPLAPGDSFDVSFQVTTPLTHGTYTNTATVLGVYLGGTVTDTDDAPILTPVELRYFRAVAEESAVRLEWATAVEVDCVGFYIYRAPDRDFGRARAIAYVPAQGSGSTYRYIDRDVTPGQVYWYWLAEVGTDGSETMYGPVWGGAGLDASPVHLYLPLVRKDRRGHVVRALK